MLEKGAVNISVVRGVLTPQRAQAMSSRGRSSISPEGGQSYSAIAMSLVFHAAHPFVPTLRADVRLFEARPCAQRMRHLKSRVRRRACAQVGGNAWYGGGCDLTPNYLTAELPDGAVDLRADCTEFHAFWRALCDEHGSQLYPQYKKWCAAALLRTCVIHARVSQRGARVQVRRVLLHPVPAGAPRRGRPVLRRPGREQLRN